jgi:hypothetical protein
VADQRISQLTSLPVGAVAAGDVLPITDISASETKKITVSDLAYSGIELLDANAIDLIKLNQNSVTKLGTTALADGVVTAAKLAGNSAVALDTSAPVTGNHQGRGFFNTNTNNLQVYDGATYQQVVLPTAGIADNAVTTAKLSAGAVTTDKVTPLNTAAFADSAITTAKVANAAITAAKLSPGAVSSTSISTGGIATSNLADDAVTYAKLQNTATSDVILGRQSAGSGVIEEIACTAAGRALLDDANAAAQRTTLGLGSMAVASGTWVDGSSFSGTSSGTNTGDQTITLTGDVTGSGTGSFATTIADNTISAAKLQTDSVTNAKIQANAVTAAKIADNSAVIVSTVAANGTGDFIGQGWLNTTTNITYRWTGTAWVQEAGIGTLSVTESTPLSIAVSYPDAYSANLTITADVQPINTVWAGPTTGADAAPTFRTLTGSDLPDATTTTKGGVIPGTGLAVSGSTLNHSNAVTGATVSGITYDNQGHITSAVALTATDIPDLSASKITTGTFPTDLIADNAITADKLANYSTAQIGETLPVADYTGQIFFNPLDKAFFLWDGNVWQPIGISQGSIIFAGTYNASTNLVASVTTEGTAIGLTVGSALPSASSANNSYYLVVATGGTGTAPAPTVTLAPPDLLLSNGTAWYEVDVSSTYASQTASNIGFTPAGSVGSTTVQGAIEEVSSECRNADNITSGTLVAARGGTGQTSYTKGDLLAASGASALSKLGVGTNGQVLRANSATATGLEWGADYLGTVTSVTSATAALTVATGTTTPALTLRSASTTVNGIVQLTDSTATTSSVLAATATAVKSAYDLANAALPKAGGVMTGELQLGATYGVTFEGATSDAFQTRLYVIDPTASRTISLPDLSGTVALTSQLDDGAY